MFRSLDVQDLVDCLRQIPPVELEALRLIRALPVSSTDGWFPAASPDGIAEAARELIAYTKACAVLADTLNALSPVILPALDILEWPL